MVQLHNVGKRYNYEWIFRQINFDLQIGGNYAITGPNGSGKSTLLQLIAGNISPSEGQVNYHMAGGAVAPDKIFASLSLAAPYLELIEEFDLTEILQFHARFKPFRDSLDVASVVKEMGMEGVRSKPIKYFSSGMKQRVKLAVALLSDVPMILLDEPATNLDEQGYQWYMDLVERYSSGRLLIIASNQEREYVFCKEVLHIGDYKNR